jgi:hypothetical protein
MISVAVFLLEFLICLVLIDAIIIALYHGTKTVLNWNADRRRERTMRGWVDEAQALGDHTRVIGGHTFPKLDKE